MNTLIWVLQGLLGAMFLLAGGMKLAQTKEKVIASGGKWAEDFSGPTIKLIGAGEVLSAVSVIIPRALDNELFFTALGAGGIMIFMAGAFVTHLRRKEPPFLVVTAVLFAMAAFVCYSRCPWTTG